MMLMDVKPEIKPEDSETAEIHELAQHIKASHDKLRSGSVPVQSTGVVTQMSQLEKVGKDTSSPLVNFGWETIPNRPVFPFVRRGTQCFVANQICRKLIFCDVYKKFSLYTTDCLPVDIQNMTQSEADVFNEINTIHCDRSLVGDHCFQEGEPMTELQDVKESFRFFEAFENIMISNKFENDLFGFIKIAHENEVPFVWSQCKKLVPLFYFEGQSEYLDSRSINLTDKWKLGYLKFCCLVQNIRRELYNASPFKVVDFEDVKKLFPEDTSFELGWPEECNEKLLAPEVRFADFPAVSENITTTTGVSPDSHFQQVPESPVAFQKSVASPGVPAQHSPPNQELLVPEMRFAELYGVRENSIPTAGVTPISNFQQVPDSYFASPKNVDPPELLARYSSLDQELLAPEVRLAAFHGVPRNCISTAGVSPISHFHQVSDSYVPSQKNVGAPGAHARYSPLNLDQGQTPNSCAVLYQSSEKIGNVKSTNNNPATLNLPCRKRKNKLTSSAGQAKRRLASRNSNNVLDAPQSMAMTPMSPSVSHTRTTNVPYRSPQTASSPELRLHSPLMSEAATSRQFNQDNFHKNYTPISIQPETNLIWQYSSTVQQEVLRQKMALTQSFPRGISSSQAKTGIPQNYQKVAYLQSSTQRPPPVASSQNTAEFSICSASVLSSSSTKSTSQISLDSQAACSALLDELFADLTTSINAEMLQSCSPSVYSQSLSKNPNMFPRTQTHEVTSTLPKNFPLVTCHQSPIGTFQRSVNYNRDYNQVPQNSLPSIESLLVPRVPSTRPRVIYGTTTALSDRFSSIAYTQSAAECPQIPTNNAKTNQTTVDEMTLRKKVKEFIIKNVNLVSLIETEIGIKNLVWAFMLEQQMTSVKQQKELGPLIKSEMQYLFKLVKQNSSVSVNKIQQQKATSLAANYYELSPQTIQNFSVTNVTNAIQMTSSQHLGNR